MKDVNKVILVGRLGIDPVQRFTKNGTSVVHFSLATSRKVPKPSTNSETSVEYIDETEWHRVVVWGKQGGNCFQYLKKGAPIYLEGNIRSHGYADKNGVNRTAYEIHADEVNFLNSNRRPSAPPIEPVLGPEVAYESVTHEPAPDYSSDAVNSPFLDSDQTSELRVS